MANFMLTAFDEMDEKFFVKVYSNCDVEIVEILTKAIEDVNKFYGLSFTEDDFSVIEHYTNFLSTASGYQLITIYRIY